MPGSLIVFGLTLLVWATFALKPVEYLKWLSWKKMARRAVSNRQTTTCRICNDHIFPSQQVVKDQDEDTHPGKFLVHIDTAPTSLKEAISFGIANVKTGHFSLKGRYVVCAIMMEGQKNIGTWNGYQFIPDSNSSQIS